jgi:CelD/BcsL family acetyltransferase involved in cellulose biosynthesis
MKTYLRLAREVARKTYQERLFDSGLPDTAEFREATLELAGRNAVRGYLLFHGGKAVAYLHTPSPDGFPVHDYLGYDPEYSPHSPGTVLQYLALHDLYAEGSFPLYSWGSGYSQAKQVFATGQVLGADIFYFRPTVRNSIAVCLHYAVDRVSERAGRLLARLNLKQALKRRLKRQ